MAQARAGEHTNARDRHNVPGRFTHGRGLLHCSLHQQVEPCNHPINMPDESASFALQRGQATQALPDTVLRPHELCAPADQPCQQALRIGRGT